MNYSEFVGRIFKFQPPDDHDYVRYLHAIIDTMNSYLEGEGVVVYNYKQVVVSACAYILPSAHPLNWLPILCETRQEGMLHL